MLLRFIILVMSICFAPIGMASESTFDRWLSWDGLRASFTQFEYDDGGELLRTSEGKAILQRPSNGVWQIHAPDPQEFFANAQGVWHYDRWLEVATFHPETGNNQSTLALFSGNRSVLEQRYEIAETDDQLLLTPSDRDSQIQSVRVTLTTEGYPRVIELHTSLGHRTLIEFSGIEAAEFSADVFDFNPPPGTEIQ